MNDAAKLADNQTPARLDAIFHEIRHDFTEEGRKLRRLILDAQEIQRSRTR